MIQTVGAGERAEGITKVKSVSHTERRKELTVLPKPTHRADPGGTNKEDKVENKKAQALQNDK